MNKPTPGPWTVNPLSLGQICTDEARPKCIALTHNFGQSPAEQAATARLIAGSQDLLSIADRFFSFYELHKSARGGQLGRDYEALRAKIMGEPKEAA